MLEVGVKRRNSAIYIVAEWMAKRMAGKVSVDQSDKNKRQIEKVGSASAQKEGHNNSNAFGEGNGGAEFKWSVGIGLACFVYFSQILNAEQKQKQFKIVIN